MVRDSRHLDLWDRASTSLQCPTHDLERWIRGEEA